MFVVELRVGKWLRLRGCYAAREIGPPADQEQKKEVTVSSDERCSGCGGTVPCKDRWCKQFGEFVPDEVFFPKGVAHAGNDG
jgi:hypothetical protein